MASRSRSTERAPRACGFTGAASGSPVSRTPSTRIGHRVTSAVVVNEHGSPSTGSVSIAVPRGTGTGTRRSDWQVSCMSAADGTGAR